MFLLHVVTVKPTIKYTEGCWYEKCLVVKLDSCGGLKKSSGKKKKKVQEPYLQEYVAQIPILLIFDLTARLPNRTPAGWGGCRGCSTGEDLAAHSFPVPMAQQPLSLWAAPGHQCPEPPRLTFVSSLSRCYDRLGNLCIPQDTIVVWSWVLKQHFLLFWLTSICSLPLPHFILRSGFV